MKVSELFETTVQGDEVDWRRSQLLVDLYDRFGRDFLKLLLHVVEQGSVHDLTTGLGLPNDIRDTFADLVDWYTEQLIVGEGDEDDLDALERFATMAHDDIIDHLKRFALK
jgi:hypothetical protein